ncbi:MAG: cyclodeaminase/cyclohydrolase family protein [Lachnospiraceae bacterium]|nr:cyclodeaminase/cyclohydrolase family protein [Lachnospiraceae bacterium]
MMAESRMDDFIKVLSSAEPVPGGGGASGYAAAIGMALGSMVANLTTGKKKYAEYQEEIDTILVKADKITLELMEFMDKDAEAFEPLSKAYGLPKNTEEEIAAREQIMAKALKEASEAPLALMEKIMEALEVILRLSEIGSRIAISDAGVGAQMCKAALNGASLNVFINTKLMKDRSLAEEMNARADEMLVKGNAMADEAYEKVVKAIRG